VIASLLREVADIPEAARVQPIVEELFQANLA
jgi:hypothetical protein